MTDPNTPTPNNGQHEDDGEQTSTPQFLQGNRYVSHDALREKIEAQFYAENEGSSALYTADKPTQQESLRDMVDYVLATEAISLTRAERAQLQEDLFRDLIGVGPLTALMADNTLSEIEIRGAYELFERHYGEEAKLSMAKFRDLLQLEHAIRRWLAPTSFVLFRDPFIETSTRLAGREARLTIITSANGIHSASLRLHPTPPRTLDELVADQMLDVGAVTLLRAILTKGFGLMLAGEASSGKTTLLQALASTLPAAEIVSVERAKELRLPNEAERLTATSEIAFPAQISAAVTSGRQVIVLDEMRFDESAEMWDALTAEQHPQCLWVVRGSSEPVRLRTAFSMAVRRARAGIEQLFINSALLDRMPFVAFVGRRENRYKLLRIGEWVSAADDPSALVLKQLWPAEGTEVSQRIF